MELLVGASPAKSQVVSAILPHQYKPAPIGTSLSALEQVGIRSHLGSCVSQQEAAQLVTKR
jgi:hypothetical protein